MGMAAPMCVTRVSPHSQVVLELYWVCISGILALSFFVASVSGTIGHVGAQVTIHENFMIVTELRVDEPATQGSLFDTSDKICVSVLEQVEDT